MIEMWIKRLSIYLLAATTGLLLVTSIPPDLEVTPAHLMYAALTALALTAGILLSQAEFSLAHMIGMLAFLTLRNPEDMPMMTWAIFFGAVVGGVGMVIRQQDQLPRRRLVHRSAENIIIIASRVTISFVIAGRLYISMGQQLPLETGSNTVLIPLLLYFGTYTTLYGAIYLLENYTEGYNIRQMNRTDLTEVTMALVLPTAYALMGALVINEMPIEVGALVIAGTVLLLISIFGYSRIGYTVNQQLNEMHMLSDLVQQLQSVSGMPMLLQYVEEKLPDALDTHHLIVSISERDTERLLHPIIVRDGNPVPFIPLDEADLHLINRMAETHEPLLFSEGVPTALQHLRIAPHTSPVASWMGAPLMVNDRFAGAIVAYSMDGGRRFTQADLRLLRIVASTLAVAVDNRQLYELQQERVTRLNTLNTVSVLLAATLDIGNVLDTITTTAGMLSEANMVLFFLNEGEATADENDFLPLARSAGASQALIDGYTRPLLSREPVVSTASDKIDTSPLDVNPPLLIPNVNLDKRTTHLRDILMDAEIMSLIELPLISGDSRIGMLVLGFTDSRSFGAEFIEFLRTFANEAVQAIRNAQLYTRTDQALERRLVQLSILAAVGQQTTASANAANISNVVLNFATNYTGAKRGVMALHNELTGELEVTAQDGYPPNIFENVAVLQQGTTGQVLSTGEYTRLDDTSEFPGTHRLMPDTVSQLSVPILREQKKALGVLTLESDERGTFNREDTHFIMQLVNQAAIAIDNYNLFQRITQTRDRLKVIQDAITEGLLLLDNAGRIVTANPAVRLIGLDAALITGRTLAALIEEDKTLLFRLGFDSFAGAERLLRQLRPGEAWTEIDAKSYTVQGERGDLYIERQIIDIRGEDGRILGALMLFYNQTEKRELDRARDDLTRMIVHDLRAPLTAMSTSLSILRRIVPEDIDNYTVVDHTLTTTHQAMHKLMKRVDSILDVAKMESGEMKLEPSNASLQELVDNVLRELYPLAREHRVNLHAEIPPDIPSLSVDREKIERVMQNLIDNALKYTPDGGQVMVRARVRQDNGERPTVQIDVIDQGPGVPLEYKERLFDRFVQISDQQSVRRGFGLGLTFCRLVVEAHHGRIWIEDNPQGGSIFAFTVPLAADAVTEGTD
jgi:two-component system, NtrC family, sensor histidine kinase KinB